MSDHERFSLIQGPVTPTGTMDVRRMPIHHRCLRCKRDQVMLLTPYPGAITWRCSCGMVDKLEMAPAPDMLIEQGAMVALRKPPIENTCDDCHARDVIVLPDDGGDYRWTCGCGSVWLIRWTPTGGMRGRVSAPVKPAPALKLNLCQCGLEGCPHCNPK